MSASEATADLTRKAGIALMMGNLINVLRVVPVFLSDGVSSENFPPHSVADITYAAQLPVWTVTHATTFAGTVLLIFGSAVFARNATLRQQAAPGLMA